LLQKAVQRKNLFVIFRRELLKGRLNVTRKDEHVEESVWVIVEVRKKSKLLVGLCYRSPGSEEFNNDKLLVRNLITTNYWRSCS
jgi:hypothetical protein